MTGHVYCLYNKANEDVFYVGSTIYDPKSRLQSHLSFSKTSNTKIYKYIRECHIEFDFKVIKTVSVDNIRDLRKMEGECIDDFLSKGTVLYNSVSPLSKKNERTEAVKIDGDVLDRIAKHVKGNTPKMSITYFASMEMSKVMDRVEKRKSKKSSLN